MQKGIPFTYFGHSCFQVEINEKKLLFDPFISPNELANSISLTELKPHFILISHGHFDHIADCLSLAAMCNAKVICSWEIHEWLSQKGFSNTHPMNIGGQWDFDTFTVKCTAAQHSSSLSDGRYGGNPMGFLITSAETNFYYSGDTALTMDMLLIPKWAKLNFAVLPIGDNFTMGVPDAIECAKMIACTKIIGVHYDTFEMIKINHTIAKQQFSDNAIDLFLLEIGETKLI